ncbi:hypothetical protein C1J05_18840 [Sulfitobacter sp. JL08]|uniref:BatD family protein n=1 Tax=Sulfitobacter sp. JL08 TaxID=2070369 RepID=UPI000E0C0FEC|nr:BatD family protein [Sulfitobacter sp. JL08]AXI56287.1 hypothetical protein C1J05_18840 [Sulfitobacter sp. JL08]
MIRFVITLCLALALALPAAAQDPKIEFSAQEDTVLLGQPLIVRLKVLVPTFMPSPPAFPSFEAPNLMVRLNGRATNPTSETIDGETWSGVIRTYTIYPMIEGTFQLPASDLTIVYQDDDGVTPVTKTLSTPAFAFTSTIPEGARGLDPVILAKDLEITQSITAADGPIKVGDAITRQLEISVEGTSPLFLPPLLVETETENLRGYPQDPKVTEAVDRGVLSGTRTEQISYIATQAGPVSLPVLQLEWFNLSSNQVETVELDGASFEIEPGPTPKREADPALILMWMALGVGGAIVGWAMWRFLWPVLRQRRARRKSERKASEAYAHQNLRKAIGHHNLNETLRWLEIWRHRMPPRSAVAQTAIDTALLSITAAQFGSGTKPDVKAAWAELGCAVEAARKAEQAALSNDQASSLPALNPF